MNSLLVPYYKNQGFLKWLSDSNYHNQNENNIANYFSLYQRVTLCKEDRCYDCAGLVPVGYTEADIMTGIVQSEKCPRKNKEGRDQAAQAIQERAVIPPVFQDITYNDLPLVDFVAIEFVKGYVEAFPKNKPAGLYLYASANGVGRTSLLWIIIQEILRQRKIFSSFVFNTVTMFIDHLQTDMYTERHEFMKQATQCDMLILDDFGREKETEWSSAKLEAILEERWWYKRPVLIASTIPPEPWAWHSAAEKSLLSKIQKSTRLITLCKEDRRETK